MIKYYGLCHYWNMINAKWQQKSHKAKQAWKKKSLPYNIKNFIISVATTLLGPPAYCYLWWRKGEHSWMHRTRTSWPYGSRSFIDEFDRQILLNINFKKLRCIVVKFTLFQWHLLETNGSIDNVIAFNTFRFLDHEWYFSNIKLI